MGHLPESGSGDVQSARSVCCRCSVRWTTWILKPMRCGRAVMANLTQTLYVIARTHATSLLLRRDWIQVYVTAMLRIQSSVLLAILTLSKVACDYATASLDHCSPRLWFACIDPEGCATHVVVTDYIVFYLFGISRLHQMSGSRRFQLWLARFRNILTPTCRLCAGTGSTHEELTD